MADINLKGSLEPRLTLLISWRDAKRLNLKLNRQTAEMRSAPTRRHRLFLVTRGQEPAMADINLKGSLEPRLTLLISWRDAKRLNLKLNRQTQGRQKQIWPSHKIKIFFESTEAKIQN